MIQAIFYARFLPQEGTKIIAQSPPGCIVPIVHSHQAQWARSRSLASSPHISSTPDLPSLSPVLAASTLSQQPHPQPRQRFPLFDFDSLQGYIIPKPAFFNRLISALTPDGRFMILGFPVAIRDSKYERNEFIFNFGIVVEVSSKHRQRPGESESCSEEPVDSQDDAVTGNGEEYEIVVRKLARTFMEMETQSGYLSSMETKPEFMKQRGREMDQGNSGWEHGELRSIGKMLVIILEDLNHNGECDISLDEANTISMKLFPYRSPPPPVKSWHVPVPKTNLAELVDATWDLTLQRLIPFIDGISDVRRIAHNADVSLKLAECALGQLAVYDTILLLDMFFFSNCYAIRPLRINDFIANRDGIVEKCAKYVCVVQHDRPDRETGTVFDGDVVATPAPLSGPSTRRNGSRSSSVSRSRSRNPVQGRLGRIDENEDNVSLFDSPGRLQPSSKPHLLPNFVIIRLMTSFCVGLSVIDWIRFHHDTYGLDVLRCVDVRRLVQFGVISGMLYRVHKYVVSKEYIETLATGRRITSAGGTDDKTKQGRVTVSTEGKESSDSSGGKKEDEDECDKWTKYFDGMHPFDQITTECNMSDAEIMESLRTRKPSGDLTLVYR